MIPSFEFSPADPRSLATTTDFARRYVKKPINPLRGKPGYNSGPFSRPAP